MVAAGFPKPAPHIYPIPSEIKRFITTHFLHPVAKLFPGACFSLLNAQTHIKKVIRPNRTNNFIIRGLPIYCTPLCSTIYYISYNITFFLVCQYSYLDKYRNLFRKYRSAFLTEGHTPYCIIINIICAVSTILVPESILHFCI